MNKDSPVQADPDDGARVLHLGRLVSADLRLPPQPRVHRRSAKLDPERLPHRRDRRNVLQQSVRGSKLRRRKVPGRQPPDRRRRDAVPRVYAIVLAVLPGDAGALPPLRADDLDHQLDRLRAHEGCAEGIRHRPHGRHHRLDSRGLALHVHPRRLGQGERRGARGTRQLARDRARIWPDRVCARAGHDMDVHRCRHCLACARGVQPHASAHAAEAGGSRR